MSRSLQRKKKERYLITVEERFRSALLDALHLAAKGHWGMFAVNAHVLKSADRSFLELNEIGSEISALRAELGITEEYWLYGRYREYRKRHGPNDPGEPRLAQEFLTEIDSLDPAPDA